MSLDLSYLESSPGDFYSCHPHLSPKFTETYLLPLHEGKKISQWSFPLNTNNIVKGNTELEKKIYAIAMFMKNTILSLNVRLIPNIYSLFLGVQIESHLCYSKGFSHSVHTVPSPGFCSVAEDHELSFGGVWQLLTFLGPLQSSTSSRTTPMAEKQPASRLA